MLVEKVLVALAGLVRLPGGPAVSRSLLMHKLYPASSLFQGLRQPLTVTNRHRFISVSVEDQERRRILRQIAQHVALFTIASRDASGPKQIDHGLHATGLPLIAALPFQFLDVAAGAKKCCQVAPRRGSHDADVLRVQVVLLGVGTEPADRCLAVLDLSRKLGVLQEAVVDAGDSVPLGDEPGQGTPVLAAATPGPTVNPDNH